jgi:hypothetical protein
MAEGSQMGDGIGHVGQARRRTNVGRGSEVERPFRKRVVSAGGTCQVIDGFGHRVPRAPRDGQHAGWQVGDASLIGLDPPSVRSPATCRFKSDCMLCLVGGIAQRTH